MSKRGICWLIVRLIGLGFLFIGLRYTLTFVENFLLISASPAGEMLASQSAGVMRLCVGEAVGSFFAGAYLLTRGEIIFEWLNFEPDE